MKNAFYPAIALLAVLILAGCAQDNTTTVNVYVNDDSGRPIDGAYVSAYSGYNLGTGVNDKWTNVNGTLTSTATTKNGGTATLQIMPGNYAFTASTNDGANGGTEKLIITKSDNVNITISKPKPKEARFVIDIVDDSGKPFDLSANTLNADTTYCPQAQGGNTNATPCGVGGGRQGTNHIDQTTTSFGTYKYRFYSEGFEDYNLNFKLSEGDYQTFTVTMKKKLKTGTAKISLMDNVTEKLIDVASQAFTMVVTFCPAEKLPDSMFSPPWSKIGNCWTTSGSNEEIKVQSNPLFAEKLSIGDWNFTFWSNAYDTNAAIFTLKENQVVEQNVFFKKKASGGLMRITPIPPARIGASPSPSQSPSAAPAPKFKLPGLQ